MRSNLHDQQNRSKKGGFPLNISQPALRALTEAGYTRLEQLTVVSEKELLNLHGMGPKGVRLLREALTEKGLSFAQAKK